MPTDGFLLIIMTYMDNKLMMMGRFVSINYGWIKFYFLRFEV